jgi:3'-phosphoadenosine 5'-phosphosulfate (PAPS) 3'-phosphatase
MDAVTTVTAVDHEANAIIVDTVRVHVPATAVVIEVPPRHGQKEPHFEIEWRGVKGRSRSGQWYHTRHGAEALAAECGAKQIGFEIEQ